MDEKINFIRHYQNSIEKSKDNLDRVLHCLKKLQNLRINVQDLQETGIGKSVNSLREIDGEVGELATELIAKWKKLIVMNEEEHKFEAPQPPREKHESKKPEKSSVESTDSSSKKSKSSSSSSSSNHHHSSSSKHHTKTHSSSSKHQTNHLSSTNNHQSSNHHSSSSSNNHHHHSEHKEKEKEHKKSNDGKSSESKHHKSSSSSHKTSNSHKRSREDVESKENEMKAKKMKSDSEKSDKKSNGSNDVKESSSTSNGTSNKSKKKEHKSSTKRKHSVDEEQEFDSTTGMGFAEALAAFDMPTSSSKRQKQELADKMISVKSSSSSSSSSKPKSSSSSSSSTQKYDKDKNKSSSSTSPRPSTSKMAQNITQPPKLLTQKPKLDLLPDIVNELPSDVSIPDYRPLPLNSAMKDYINSNVNALSSMTSRHNRAQTESELLTDSITSQKGRTRVYSGNTRARSEIPKLYESCLRVLTENLDYVECTGGIPFDIIKPALEKAKPEQLANIEYYNPYLLDDSDILWKPHCQRKWKNRQPEEMESWRDMYERCTRDDAEKLSRLTQNIKQSQEKTSNGIQKTKMAFVDTMVKAPRGIVRKQEQFGTSRKVVASPAARTEGLKNIQPNLAVPGDVRLRVAAGLRDDAQQIVGRGTVQRGNLVKKAPMMAKILSKFKR